MPKPGRHALGKAEAEAGRMIDSQTGPRGGGALFPVGGGGVPGATGNVAIKLLSKCSISGFSLISFPSVYQPHAGRIGRFRPCGVLFTPETVWRSEECQYTVQSVRFGSLSTRRF
jgi:hypothetical protein